MLPVRGAARKPALRPQLPLNLLVSPSAASAFAQCRVESPRSPWRSPPCGLCGGAVISDRSSRGAGDAHPVFWRSPTSPTPGPCCKTSGMSSVAGKELETPSGQLQCGGSLISR